MQRLRVWAFLLCHSREMTAISALFVFFSLSYKQSRNETKQHTALI